MKDRALSTNTSPATGKAAAPQSKRLQVANLPNASDRAAGQVQPEPSHDEQLQAKLPKTKQSQAKPQKTQATSAQAKQPTDNATQPKKQRTVAMLPSGPFVLKRKRSPLSQPLVASGLIGVGGLALTLAVGWTLTEEADQPNFSFRENPTPEPFNADAASTSGAGLTAETVKPSLGLPEFSSSSRVKPSAGRLPEVSVSRTLRSPGRSTAIAAMLDQQSQDLDRLARALAAQNSTAQPAIEGALSQAMKDEAASPDASAQSPVQSEGQTLPSVSATSPEVTVAEMPSVPATPEVGTSAQAPAEAGIPGGSGNAIAAFDPSTIQKLAVSPSDAPATPAAPTAAPMAMGALGRFVPASELAVNPSMTLAAYAATVPADMLDELYAMQAAGSVDALQSTQTATAPTAAAAEAPVATAAPQPETNGNQGIRYFVALAQEPNNPQRVWMLPLTNQAATEVASADKVDAFRVFRLPTQEYQRVWLAVRSVNPSQEASAPLYGFIDYQRQIIVMPVAAAAATPAAPAS